MGYYPPSNSIQSRGECHLDRSRGREWKKRKGRGGKRRRWRRERREEEEIKKREEGKEKKGRSGGEEGEGVSKEKKSHWLCTNTHTHTHTHTHSRSIFLYCSPSFYPSISFFLHSLLIHSFIWWIIFLIVTVCTLQSHLTKSGKVQFGFAALKALISDLSAAAYSLWRSCTSECVCVCVSVRVCVCVCECIYIYISLRGNGKKVGWTKKRDENKDTQGAIESLRGKEEREKKCRHVQSVRKFVI